MNFIVTISGELPTGNFDHGFPSLSHDRRGDGREGIEVRERFFPFVRFPWPLSPSRLVISHSSFPFPLKAPSSSSCSVSPYVSIERLNLGLFVYQPLKLPSSTKNFSLDSFHFFPHFLHFNHCRWPFESKSNLVKDFIRLSTGSLLRIWTKLVEYWIWTTWESKLTYLKLRK